MGGRDEDDMLPSPHSVLFRGSVVSNQIGVKFGRGLFFTYYGNCASIDAQSDF